MGINCRRNKLATWKRSSACGKTNEAQLPAPTRSVKRMPRRCFHRWKLDWIDEELRNFVHKFFVASGFIHLNFSKINRIFEISSTRIISHLLGPLANRQFSFPPLWPNDRCQPIHGRLDNESLRHIWSANPILSSSFRLQPKTGKLGISRLPIQKGKWASGTALGNKEGKGKGRDFDPTTVYSLDNHLS